MNPQRLVGPLLCYGAIVLGVGIVRGDHSIAGYIALRESRAVLEETVGSLESENAQLSKEIVKLKSSRGYARKVLRDKYHITDDDEKIIFFAD